MFNPRELLNIIEIVIYIPILIFSVVVASRHGFQRGEGWIFLVILALIRLLGGVIGIIGFFKVNIGIIVTTVILNSIGLSPLLLAMLGILRRINQKQPTPISPRFFRLAYLPTLAGFILAIIAGVDSSSSSANTLSQGSTFSKIAVILFLVALIAQSFMAWTMFRGIRFLDSGEQKLLYAVGVGMPFLAVRILFSFLLAFGVSPGTFNLVGIFVKQVVTQALMAVAPETIVVLMYLISGLLLPIYASGPNMKGPERVYQREYQRPPISEDTAYEGVGETHAMLGVAGQQNDGPQPQSNAGYYRRYEPLRGEA